MPYICFSHGHAFSFNALIVVDVVLAILVGAMLLVMGMPFSLLGKEVDVEETGVNFPNVLKYLGCTPFSARKCAPDSPPADAPPKLVAMLNPVCVCKTAVDGTATGCMH